MKSARRILAILLALCLAFAIAACGGDDAGTSSPATSSNGGDSNGSGDTGDSNTGDANTDSGNGSSANGPKELGFYDRDYDYTQHKQFKVAYLVSGPGVMFDSFDLAFATWAERLNVNYTGMWTPAELSNEAFLSGVETYADMGYDALLIDADTNLGAAIAKICDDNDILWMMAMGQARDYSTPYSIMGTPSIGPLLAPNVGFNNVAVGQAITDGLMDWKEKAFPDVGWEKVGFISMDFSLSPQLHERTDGNELTWAERTGFGGYNPDPTVNPTNFIIADSASGGFDQATGTNLITQILSNPPAGIEVWLVATPIWDLASGAAIAFDNVNLTEKACVTTFGAGANSIALWDAGENTSIRIALETASPVYAESIFNGLWAMMAGFATPDTLWSEWAVIYDRGDVYKLTSDLDPVSQTPIVELGADGLPVIEQEHHYASMILPMIWTTQDNYKEFYGWVDLYQFGSEATAEERTYPDYPLAADINLFAARGEVPDFYKSYPSA